VSLLLALLACAADVPAPAAAPPAPKVDAAPPPPDPTPAPGTTITGDPHITSPSVVQKPGEEPKYYTLLGALEGVVFSGDWTSPSCGGRGYPRNIRFEEVQKRWAMVDLVNPCPVGKECGWNGMQHTEGLWDHDKARIYPKAIGGGKQPQAFTATSNGRLVESGCVYVRGLTVPEGYTPEQVRPVPKAFADGLPHHGAPATPPTEAPKTP
jgi:hypothetical protein